MMITFDQSCSLFGKALAEVRKMSGIRSASEPPNTLCNIYDGVSVRKVFWNFMSHSKTRS
jgi:hypothetical protein